MTPNPNKAPTQSSETKPCRNVPGAGRTRGLRRRSASSRASIAASRSGVRGSGGEGLTTRRIIRSVSPPIGKLIKKTQRQETYCVLKQT